MGVSHDQRNLVSRIARAHARTALLNLAAFSLLIATLPQNGTAQQAAAPTPVAANTTEIESATNIKAQPLALLAKFPDAGPAMARFVAEQLTAQPAMIDAMLSIVNDTSPAQASAMGAGMVRAVRALGPKQAATARSISDKVMRSDNKWLTTTFSSLGPRYRPNAPFATFANVPPREFAAMGEMGSGIGAAWRVGPAENETFTERDGNKRGNECLYFSDVYVNGACHGTIVAIISSDAKSNGAVSTSPTI